MHSVSRDGQRIELSTRQLEVAPGDMLRNREAVFADVEKASDLVVV